MKLKASHHILQEEVTQCIRELEQVVKNISQLGVYDDWDLFISQWEYLKYQLAQAAVSCLATLFPGKIREAYYIDLSGGEAGAAIGRDVDLIVVVDDTALVYRDELENFLAHILEKLLHEAGMQPHQATTAPTTFEIHVVGEKDKTYYYKLLTSKYTPPLRIWP